MTDVVGDASFALCEANVAHVIIDGRFILTPDAVLALRAATVAECIVAAEAVRAKWQAEASSCVGVGNDDGGIGRGLRAAGARDVVFALRALAWRTK